MDLNLAESRFLGELAFRSRTRGRPKVQQTEPPSPSPLQMTPNLITSWRRESTEPVPTTMAPVAEPDQANVPRRRVVRP
jgi:hypothetical protein